jgi:capsular exopolysaccharide synthesis family protein
MSEIFNYLKKTDAEKRKSPVFASPIHSAISIPKEPSPEPEFDEAVQPTLPVESPRAGAGIFDLTCSSYQMQNVLDPLTIVGEQFRVLRTQLDLMQKQTGIKTVLVTSTVPQEGKSFTAYGLAGVMAQEVGKRVLLFDADMRKSGSGRDFGLNGSSSVIGTAQVLEGAKEFRSALLTGTNPELWFLPAGALPSNPSELLSSPKLEQALKSAAEIFDWIIVDSPPILALSDASLIAPLCDTVLLVVRVNSTPTKLVSETVNRIGRDHICGIVLNRQKEFHSSRYYYHYYYRGAKRK